MHYLFDIFSSNSDKARAITVIFSTVVALLIVFLNQSHVRARDRRSLKLEKLEALFDAVNQYEHDLLKYHSELDIEDNDLKKIVRCFEMQAANLLNDIEKYISLYFKDIEYPSEKMVILCSGWCVYDADDPLFAQNIKYNLQLAESLNVDIEQETTIGNVLDNPKFVEYVNQRRPESPRDLIKKEIGDVLKELRKIKIELESRARQISGYRFRKFFKSS